VTKWTSIASDDVAASVGAGFRSVEGQASSRQLSPDNFSLWLVETDLSDAATLSWSAHDSDDAVFVLNGELDVEGRSCPAGGAVIVERGARVTATAKGSTSVAHFGSRSHVLAPPGPLHAPGPGGRVHVVGPAGRFESGARENVSAVWFADGTCDSCRVQLFTVETPVSDDRRGRPHSHSQDEIIYLIDGAVSMGTYTFGPGTAVSIPADVRYALTAQDGGHRFLNFRRDVSWQIYELGSEPIIETAVARGGRPTDDA